MRNLKKFLALVLATMMLLSVAVISTSAADKADYTDAANRLAALQVMKGDENGNLMLENGVTRYQAALFFVQTLTGETDTAVWNADKKSANFADVVDYGTAIDYANGIGIVKGRGNGVFGYNDAITYQDMLVMAVRALGYETKDMSYPYGYILAAQKLGLTDNVDLVNYKAALTRGETAQVIWDMLNTQVAVVDPLTDKVYYPEANETTVDGKTGYFTENSLGKFMPREELIVDSELAGDKITVKVMEFVEGDEDEETVDTLEIAGVAGIETIAAADLGITVDTPAIAYKGLPVELFISVDADDFTQEAYDDGDAEVVFASFPEYTTVQNLAADGDIKYVVDIVEGEGDEEDVDKSYLSLAGVKFKAADYNFVTYTFDGVWEAADEDVEDIFVYNAKADDVYENGGDNTYGEVSYRVIESADKNVKGTVELLYTDYEFGQYNVREFDGVKYTVIGTYNATAKENMDEVTSHFVEKLVGYDKVITSATTKVTPSQGEAASTVVVEGAAVEAGDFMFYNYNETDNILTVAMNAGKFQTGKLSGQSPKAETVTINGAKYGFGFAGHADVDFATTYGEYDVQGDYINKLESGKENVKFLVVDGKIVYMEEYDADDNAAESKFPYAIVDFGVELAELLDLDYYKTLEDGSKVYDTEGEFAKAIAETSGLYVEDGVVKVAMLNLTTGKWELASIGKYAQDWSDEKDKFLTVSDLAEDAKWAFLSTNTKFNYVRTVAETKGLVTVVEEKDGVYTIAEKDNDFYATTTGTALKFYDNSNLTNFVKVDAEDASVEARIALDDETVVVVIVDGVAAARVGVQPADASLNFAGTFYSTTSDLIVYVANEGTTFDVADWKGVEASSDDKYYISTLETTVNVDAGDNEDDPYTVTVFNVYDMKAMEIVESVVFEMEDITTGANAALVALEDENVIIAVVDGELEVGAQTLAEVLVAVANDNEDKDEYTLVTNVADFRFDDATSVTIGDITDGRVVKPSVTVVTLDMIALAEGDKNEYDLSAVVANKAYDESYDFDEAPVTIGGEKVNLCAYNLNLNLVNETNEPEEGVLDNNIMELYGETLLAPNADAKKGDYTDALEIGVELVMAYTYDVDTNEIDIVVYKVLTRAVEIAE